ncbi:MAG: asparagine synthase (glutamine-hydrolyzing) [Gemmataceae bacterium]
MCGIAGIIDLTGRNLAPTGVVRRMADAIIHRGPDEEGYLDEPEMVLANRRLSIVGLADGQQPIWNEDRSVVTVFNGEFFDYPEMRTLLESRGHRFATHCDTELIPHLWEDHHEQFLDHLRGQFAIAVYDYRRRQLVLARDRFGICPLFWTRQKDGSGDWLLFASEIKAILASGMVEARTDLRGLDQVFNFFAVPGPATCFEGIQALQPGHMMSIQLGRPGEPARLRERPYWMIDFPNQGDEDPSDDPRKLVDEFEDRMLAAVERRLRADVPVVSYLSGGIDSSLVVAMAARIRGTSIPTFTIKVPGRLDETDQAAVTSRHIGAEPIVVRCGDEEITHDYPELIRAAEAPVIDTSCVGLMGLARSVHQHGFKVALTGEGSDEWLAGYAWFKIHRLLGYLDIIPGVPLSKFLRRGIMRAMGAPKGALAYVARIRNFLGDHTPYQDIYGVMGQSRLRFFSPQTLETLGDYLPYEDLAPPLERIRRWHPMNRAFFWAGRIHLVGHLLASKGDRVAMHSSVETRYPFLDEEVFAFLARIHPKWKLRRFQDKYILRLLGERYLPREVAWRPKGMFRAPLDSFFSHGTPPYVDQLLSEESLRKTGYFNLDAVKAWQRAVFEKRLGFRNRSSVELGLVGVLATQLWHHTYIDGSLCALPGAAKPQTLRRPELVTA